MKQLFIDFHKDYIAAIKMQDNNLTDYFAVSKDNIVNNIYIGKVENIRGQKCFVNFDENRNNGILEMEDKKYKSGDFIRCLVKRDEMGDKGAVLSDEITLPGRYAILVEGMRGYKFSHRLQKRDIYAIKNILPKADDYGFIIRKEAVLASVERLEAEIKKLIKIYESLNKDFSYSIQCIYKSDLIDLVLSQTNGEECQIIINSNEAIGLDEYSVYEGIQPMQDFYCLREQVNELFKRKLLLKNGAEIVFDDTEAMTVIDVNSKGYNGDINRLNRIAAEEILRQIQLRNLSGLIMIDFISAKDNEKLVEYISNTLKNDKEKAKAIGISEYSLIAINRQKRYNTFKSLLYENCDKCDKGLTEKISYKCQKVCEDILNLYVKTEFKCLLISIENKLFDEFIISANYYLKSVMKKSKIYVANNVKENYTLTITDDKEQFSDAYLLKEAK